MNPASSSLIGRTGLAVESITPSTARTARQRAFENFRTALRYVSGVTSGGSEEKLALSAEPKRWRGTIERGKAGRLYLREVEAVISPDWSHLFSDLAADLDLLFFRGIVPLGFVPIAPVQGAEEAWRVRIFERLADTGLLMVQSDIYLSRFGEIYVISEPSVSQARAAVAAAARHTAHMRLHRPEHFRTPDDHDRRRTHRATA